MNRFPIALVLFLLGVMVQSAAAETAANYFEPITIDDALPRAYQVAIADINHDGKPDIAALGEGKESGVVWYENPTWKRRPISGGDLQDCIDLAFYDVDGDGELETAVASGFDLQNSKSGGQISWLKRNQDLAKPWTAYPIHAEPTAHRLRWVDSDGDGKKELVVLPILGAGASAPQYDQAPARLLRFTVPAHPQTDPWPMEVIDQTQHLAHGLFIDSEHHIWTAGLEGIVRFSFKPNAMPRWDKQVVALGAPKSEGRPGSSEIALGRLRDKSFVTSIDPWHGNQLAFYPMTAESRFPLERKVLDSSFDSGHALACADFDGDDEIIAGYRGTGYTIYLYDYDRQGTGNWKRVVIDRGGAAAQGFAVVDLNQDGLLDFVAGGGTTHNVKVYLNRFGKK